MSHHHKWQEDISESAAHPSWLRMKMFQIVKLSPVPSPPLLPSTLPSILWQSAWTFAWLGAPGCISMPCAGYWLGQTLSSPHQPRLSACGSVWLFDVTCVSLSSFPSYFAVFHLVCASSNASDVASGPAAVSGAWCFFASHLACKTNWLLLWGGKSRAPGVFLKLVCVCSYVCVSKECGEYINVDSLFELATKVISLTGSLFIRYSQFVALKGESVPKNRKFVTIYSTSRCSKPTSCSLELKRRNLNFHACSSFAYNKITYRIYVELQKSTRNIQINPDSTKYV